MPQNWAEAQVKQPNMCKWTRKLSRPCGPWGAEEMGTMMQFWDWSREKLLQSILTKDDLNTKEKLVGIEQAIAGMNLW